MGKIKIITPVHIFNGELIPAIKKNGYMYSVDYLMNKVITNANYDFLRNITKKISQENISNEEYVRMLNIDDKYFISDNAISRNISYGNYANSSYKIACAENVMGKPYIPGSTLKGLIFNVFWFNLIKTNQDIANYLKNSSNIKRQISNLDNKGKSLRRFFVVRDINFIDDFVLYEVNRYPNSQYNKNYQKKRVLPCGNIETIDMNSEIDCEIVKKLTDVEMKELTDSKNRLVDECNAVERQYVEALFDFIVHFKDLFQKYNYNFMQVVIQKELEYVQKTTYPDVNKTELLNLYHNIQERINKNEIIVQIGKFTNYFDKSFCCSFGEFYYNRFNSLFSPNKKKNTPTIDTMNLITVNKKGIKSLGYISLEF